MLRQVASSVTEAPPAIPQDSTAINTKADDNSELAIQINDSQSTSHFTAPRENSQPGLPRPDSDAASTSEVEMNAVKATQLNITSAALIAGATSQTSDSKQDLTKPIVNEIKTQPPVVPSSTWGRIKDGFQRCKPSLPTRENIYETVRFTALSLYPVDLRRGWKSKVKNLGAWTVQHYFAVMASMEAHEKANGWGKFSAATIAVPLAIAAYWAAAKGFGSAYKAYEFTNSKKDQVAALVKAHHELEKLLIAAEKEIIELKKEILILKTDQKTQNKGLVSQQSDIQQMKPKVDKIDDMQEKQNALQKNFQSLVNTHFSTYRLPDDKSEDQANPKEDVIRKKTI